MGLQKCRKGDPRSIPQRGATSFPGPSRSDACLKRLVLKSTWLSLRTCVGLPEGDSETLESYPTDQARELSSPAYTKLLGLVDLHSRSS